MREKIKKFFLNFNWNKKQLFFAVLILIFLGLVLPFHSAQAFAWLAGLIAAAITILALQALVAITSGILWLATATLSWVTSENFITLPYTQGGIVEIGWPLVRDFANMAIVIFLVVIGLATALRIGDYQAKKTLPVLIIVALLVNFSPVICGVVIDAANIVMNFFLEGIKEIDHMYAHFHRLGQEILNSLEEGGLVGFFTLLFSGLFIRPIVISIFNIGAAILLFLFSFIFVLRYVALWTLVILSPLAFVCYILPATKRIWNMWLTQFIQWSIIGIPMAFFLYLGWQIIGMIDVLNLSMAELPGSTEAPGVVAQLFNEVLPYFVVLAFLALGFVIGLSSGAMGAGQILTWGKKGGTWVGKQAGKFTAGAVRGVPVVTKAESAARRRLERVPVLGRAIGGAGAYGAELAAAKKREGMKLELMGSRGEIMDAIRPRPITREDHLRRARGLEILAEKGWLGGTKGEMEEQLRWFQESQAYGIENSKILDAMPHWAGDPGVAPRGVKPAEAIRRHVEGMKADEFWQRVKPDALTNLDVFYGMDLSKARRLGERGGRAQKEALRDTIVREQAKIQAEINRLRGAGQAREAKRLRDMANYIWKSYI